MGGKIDIPIEVYQSLKDDIPKKHELITSLSKNNSELSDKFNDLRAKAIDLVASSFRERLFNRGSITKGIKKYDYGEGKG